MNGLSLRRTKAETERGVKGRDDDADGGVSQNGSIRSFTSVVFFFAIP